jgi:transcription antitermination factor NusA-like protein
MNVWLIIIGACAAVVYLVSSIDAVGSALGKRLEELHEKVDTLQEKVDEIESSIESQRIDKHYVNPIDL